jgi:hypothetical protein
MRAIHELIDREDPAWPLVQEQIAQATNAVEMLPPPDEAARQRALLGAQVTTRAPMGAIVYETGGILVDHGWLRILGAGHSRLPRSLPEWNLGRSVARFGGVPGFVLIADDVVGGFYAVDGGALGHAPGKVCYFAPSTLEWENTKLGYSEFLFWCLRGNTAGFYADTRWLAGKVKCVTWEGIGHLVFIRFSVRKGRRSLNEVGARLAWRRFMICMWGRSAWSEVAPFQKPLGFRARKSTFMT